MKQIAIKLASKPSDCDQFSGKDVQKQLRLQQIFSFQKALTPFLEIYMPIICLSRRMKHHKWVCHIVDTFVL